MWSLLKNLGCLHDLLWLVCGDFNEIMYSFEKVGKIRRMRGEWKSFEEYYKNVK